MKDVRFALLATIPIAIFLLAWSFYPLAYSFWLSLQQFKVQHGQLTSVFVGLQNYVQQAQNPDVTDAAVRSLRYVAIALPLAVLASLAIALVLNEAIPGSTFIKIVALLPWAVSDYGSGVVWRFLWQPGFGFVNAVLIYLGLVKGSVTFLTADTALPQVALAVVWHIAPLGAFFVLASLQVIPEDLYKQAKIDGANAWGRFRNITFPFINYALLITLVICTLFTLETLDEVLTMTAGGPGNATQLLTFEIYRLTFSDFNFGGGAAVSYYLLIIVFILATAWFQLLKRRH